MDDGCSWLLLQGGRRGGNGGDMRQYTASCDPSAGLHHKQEEQEVISCQALHQQLSQIYMLMDVEDNECAATLPHRASLPSSSSFRSFSGSRDDNSSLMLTAASTTTSCHHHPEVSSQIPLFFPIAYGDGHHQYYTSHDMIPNLEFTYQEAHQEQARCTRGHGTAAGATACAFRPYSRSLSPKKKLKPGACGQRAIKTAMSVLSRMHMARLSQYYQMEMSAQTRPSAPAGGSNCNQLQHVLSERKRREKLNDSFKALRTVLPPASKKDKASILIRAKDYVNTLKSRVSELEEKNRMLLESDLHRGGDDDDGKQDDVSRDNIEIAISRSAAEVRTLVCQEFHLKIVLRSGCSVMDAVVGILHCLKERGNVSLMAMNIDSSSSGVPREKSFPRATVTLQLKSSSCDEDFLKESVIKAVKDVMQSEKETP